MDGVGRKPKLGADEHKLLTTRTHLKVLFRPALALILTGAIVGAGAAMIPQDAQPAGQAAVALLGLVLAVWWVVIPYLRWRTTTYTITTRRLLMRRGILNTIGHDLPLNRISEVTFERSLADRVLGCGTLQVATAAEEGTIVLVDVPDVEHVHAELTELLFGPAVPVLRPTGPA